MWIGYPWDVREVKNPRRGLQKTTTLNVAEKSALSGALRTTSRRNAPRRWQAEFAWMPEAQADWLFHLAARTHGPGPFVVIDASTRNYLAPLQSIGRGRPSLFSPTVGTVVSTAEGGVEWDRDGGGDLRWVHPVWTRWPVVPGLSMSFGHQAAGHAAGLEFFDDSGASLAVETSAGGIVTTTPPAGARWATPLLRASGAGELLAPRACLRYGKPVTEPWPDGEHTGAMAITAHAETVEKLPERTVTLELVEF